MWLFRLLCKQHIIITILLIHILLIFSNCSKLLLPCRHVQSEPFEECNQVIKHSRSTLGWSDAEHHQNEWKDHSGLTDGNMVIRSWSQKEGKKYIYDLHCLSEDCHYFGMDWQYCPCLVSTKCGQKPIVYLWWVLRYDSLAAIRYCLQ